MTDSDRRATRDAVEAMLVAALAAHREGRPVTFDIRINDGPVGEAFLDDFRAYREFHHVRLPSDGELRHWFTAGATRTEHEYPYQ